MIVLLDGVSYAFKCRRRMIEFSRNFNPKIGMSRHGVIINRDAAIGRNELTVFGQHQRIDLKRPCADDSPHEATASLTAESSGPRFTSQLMRRVEAARSSIPDPPPPAKMITGARAASSMANERKNSRSIAIFSSTRTASTGNCPTFIDSIRAA